MTTQKQPRLDTVSFGGKEYKVDFRQTRKFSHTGMKKKGLVHHATTSNSYVGGRDWLVHGYDPAKGTYGNGGSALFVVGRNVGEICQLGEINQKQWHAGRISQPNDRFKRIAEYKNTVGGEFVNPNLYLDGVEFVGGIDRDKSGKVEKDEINLTEWQYACGVQIAKWHAEVNGYELTEETQIIHQDVTHYKPDLTEILEELLFRLFKKKDEDKGEELEVQLAARDAEIIKLKERIALLKRIIGLWLKLKAKQK